MSKSLHRCALGCAAEFQEPLQLALHEAQEAHCARCGCDLGERWNAANWASMCQFCTADSKDTGQVEDV